MSKIWSQFTKFTTQVILNLLYILNSSRSSIDERDIFFSRSCICCSVLLRWYKLFRSLPKVFHSAFQVSSQISSLATGSNSAPLPSPDAAEVPRHESKSSDLTTCSCVNIPETVPKAAGRPTASLNRKSHRLLKSYSKIANYRHCGVDGVEKDWYHFMLAIVADHLFSIWVGCSCPFNILLSLVILAVVD